MTISLVVIAVVTIQMLGWSSGSKRLNQITDENGSVILGSGSAYCGRPLQGTLTSSRNYFAASVGIGTYRYSFSYWDGTPYPIFPICDTAGPDPSVNVIYSSCCCGPVVSPVPASCPRSWGYRGTSARYSFLRSFDSTASVQISRLSLSAAPRYCLAGTCPIVLGRNNSIRLWPQYIYDQHK